MNPSLTCCVAAPVSAEARIVCRLLEQLRGGLLELRLPGGANLVFGDGESGVSWVVHDEAVFARILARGDIGLAESYVDGQWSCSDLVALLTLFARNREQLRDAVYGNRRRLLLARLRHALHRNSRAGSRRNIMAHYDLGNDFYRLWLDETMSYSSALFAGEDGAQDGLRGGRRDGDELASAQRAKYRRILQRLGARRGQSVLEIGCGWGGFAELALADGLRVTGITLSPAQLDWARRRVPHADLRLCDYRDLRERFDHVVSIEMFEAVGERWWPAYFRAVAAALGERGTALIQSITLRDDLFAAYRRSTDFIQQYVFPGGMLPSRAAFRAAAARAGLAVRDEFAFGQHYARTLAAWRAACERNWPQLAALGFDDTFRRLWRMYLSYCEAGFRAGNIDVVQFELAHR